MKKLKLKSYKDYVNLSEFIQKEKMMAIKAQKKIKLVKLRASRKRNKLSIPALAKKAGLSKHATYWADHGKPVRAEVGEQLAKALGVLLASLRS